MWLSADSYSSHRWMDGGSVYHLCYALRRSGMNVELSTCAILTASSSVSAHWNALGQLARVVGVTVTRTVSELIKWFHVKRQPFRLSGLRYIPREGSKRNNNGAHITASTTMSASNEQQSTNGVTAAPNPASTVTTGPTTTSNLLMSPSVSTSSSSSSLSSSFTFSFVVGQSFCGRRGWHYHCHGVKICTVRFSLISIVRARC